MTDNGRTSVAVVCMTVLTSLVLWAAVETANDVRRLADKAAERAHVELRIEAYRECLAQRDREMTADQLPYEYILPRCGSVPW